MRWRRLRAGKAATALAAMSLAFAGCGPTAPGGGKVPAPAVRVEEPDAPKARPSPTQSFERHATEPTRSLADLLAGKLDGDRTFGRWRGS